EAAREGYHRSRGGSGQDRLNFRAKPGGAARSSPPPLPASAGSVHAARLFGSHRLLSQLYAPSEGAGPLREGGRGAVSDIMIVGLDLEIVPGLRRQRLHDQLGELQVR